MEKKEMTLGQEIINLAKEGVDIPTVEKIYNKYLQSRGLIPNASYGINPDTVGPTHYMNYAKAALNNIYGVNSIFTKKRADTDDPNFLDSLLDSYKPYRLPDIYIGRHFVIKLSDLGPFIVTVHQICGNWVFLMFDEYVAKRPMNANGENKGGYEKSDLKKWIDVELFNQFPEEFRKRMVDLTIPTIGEMFGWSDALSTKYEHDTDKQLAYMRLKRHRCTDFNDNVAYGWLRNACEVGYSTTGFAGVGVSGDLYHYPADFHGAVRPQFWFYNK